MAITKVVKHLRFEINTYTAVILILKNMCRSNSDNGRLSKPTKEVVKVDFHEAAALIDVGNKNQPILMRTMPPLFPCNIKKGIWTLIRTIYMDSVDPIKRPIDGFSIMDKRNVFADIAQAMGYPIDGYVRDIQEIIQVYSLDSGWTSGIE
ncbi:hypothetical protein L2E82_10832 [Cichorium intybus]|uniref:Uncharacterized protein n=1 Tax=Cichorium intybus TaxID=13427 RepID=A0ACB9GBF4_CICIN|nr:hypothetical protein L2E82_10832 [Cichorium intybus]